MNAELSILCLSFIIASLNAIVSATAWGVVLMSIVCIAFTFYALARLRPIEPTLDASLSRADAPLVSIVVPVRNEAGRVLRESIGSLLAQDYGSFEVVAVNDRSTDETGAILAAMARDDARLRVVEGSEPPAGWLGKPFAMRQGLAHARGDWALATDADMILNSAALRTAMSDALKRDLDALTLLPHFESGSFWERVVIPTWVWVLLLVFVLYRVNHPRSRGALGIGGFFLVRRSALERIGGYEALKDEAAEDFRLAEMLKQTGASVRFERAPRLARTRMYKNFRELWECHAKNWFAGAKYSLPLAVISVIGVYLFGVVPPLVALACAVGLAFGADAELWRALIPAALAWAMQVLLLALLNRRLKVPLRYALLTPLGLALLYAILLDSALRITTGRGVTWKGRSVYERAGGMRPPRGGKSARIKASVEADE
jgi:cellulose synthase/poly-beta-1,6-N-acetylglucosamine synthase-like glycosyltransferase